MSMEPISFSACTRYLTGSKRPAADNHVSPSENAWVDRIMAEWRDVARPCVLIFGAKGVEPFQIGHIRPYGAILWR